MTSNMRAIFSIITGLLVFTLVVRAQEARGSPGVDYPNYLSVPKTSFSCSEQKYIPGFYADLETKCQAFHYCFENRQETFLCPVGTTFNQAILTCDFWYSSNCSLAPQFYSVNSESILESAIRNVPMLMKLKNRAQNKSIRTSADNVYDKIQSLYESNAAQLDTTADLAVDINEESIPKTGNDRKSHEMSVKSLKRDVENESVLRGDILSRFEASIPNGKKSEDMYYRDAFEANEDEVEVETLLYDPITEDYFSDYSSQNEWEDEVEVETLLYDPITEDYFSDDSPQNEWQQDPENAIDQLGSLYDYESFAKKYGVALQDYIKSSSNSGSEFSKRLIEINERVNEGTDDKGLFSRRISTEQSSKRIRRKPIYTVVREDDESEIPGGVTGVQYPGRDSEDGTVSPETVSTDTEVGSEPPADSSTERIETEERTAIPVEITNEMKIPSFTPLNTSEVPLTSEEFEHAILTELVLPRIHEHDLKLLASEQDQFNEESSTETPSAFQADDRFAYVEDITPEEYESYSSEYNRGDIVIVERPESDVVAHSSEEQMEWYESGKTAEVEDSVGTYVVIPDESDDSVLDRYTEMNRGADSLYSSYYGTESDEEHESDPTYDSYDEFKNYFRYESPEAYDKVYPTPYQVAELKYANEVENQFTPERYLSPDLLNSPYVFAYESSYTADDTSRNGRVFPRFHFATEDPAARYLPPAESGSYAYDQPMNLQDYMYGIQEVYPYVFGDPRLQIWRQMGYPELDFDYLREPEALNEISDSPLETRPEYLDSIIPHWIQRDSSESSEMEKEQIKVTDSPPQTEEIIANLYRDATSNTNEDLDEESFPAETIKVEPFSVNENMKQAETYYVLDFEDVESKTEVKLPANVETSVSDKEKVDSKESKQAVKPLLPNESFEGDFLSNINVGGKFSTQTDKDVLLTEGQSVSEKANMKSSDIPDNVESAINSKSAVSDTWPFETTESSITNEKPITLSSALERLAGLKPVRAPRASDARNIYISDKFLDSMTLPGSSDFVPYGVAANMGQQYSVDSMTSSKENDAFSHRTGNSVQPNISKLSALQERIRSIKQGKFGAFKKYVSSAGNKE